MQQADQHASQHSSQDLITSNCLGWDRALARFLRSAGLEQALIGFENDMLVLNLDTEKEDLPPALEQLRYDLTRVSKNEDLQTIEDRKLAYIRLANAKAPLSHTQLNHSISNFLAQNRARNNISNRNEFLGKRKRLHIVSDETAPEGPSSMEVKLPTCARTDAVPVNRDVQMKYDIAKNEDGPLRRTLNPEQINDDARNNPASQKGKGKASPFGDIDNPTLQKHPGLGERFAVLENHLAVRYVPSPPASLLDRVRFLEDHIIRLERDYPPWAALHFNQPNRGWPPPPRATPLIIPSHLTSTSEPPLEEDEENRDAGSTTPTSLWPADRPRAGSSRGNATKPKAKAKSSSLHRAVMQKLEVKKALAGD